MSAMNESTDNNENEQKLRLEVLPKAQRRLWEELSDTPAPFILYGGTAIALRLGHRQSVDFDFFAFSPIDSNSLMQSVPYLAGATSARTQPNTLNAIVDRDGPVQVSFFGFARLRTVRPPTIIESPRVKIADMLDLAGMKMAVIQHRAQAKDYLDIHAIWTQTDITPEQSIAAASIIYGDQYNPYDTLKALTYFGESELEALPDDLKSFLIKASTGFDMIKMRHYLKEFTS